MAAATLLLGEQPAVPPMLCCHGGTITHTHPTSQPTNQPVSSTPNGGIMRPLAAIDNDRWRKLLCAAAIGPQPHPFSLPSNPAVLSPPPWSAPHCDNLPHPGGPNPDGFGPCAFKRRTLCVARTSAAGAAPHPAFYGSLHALVAEILPSAFGGAHRPAAPLFHSVLNLQSRTRFHCPCVFQGHVLPPTGTARRRPALTHGPLFQRDARSPSGRLPAFDSFHAHSLSLTSKLTAVPTKMPWPPDVVNALGPAAASNPRPSLPLCLSPPPLPPSPRPSSTPPVLSVCVSLLASLCALCAPHLH